METLKNYVDWKLAHSDKIANAEGYPCILKKSKKGNLKELVIEGNTGKNLFDMSKITKFVKYNNGGFDIETTGSTISDGVIVNNEGIYQGSIFAWDSCTELEAGTYTISADFMSNRDDGNKHAVLYVRDYNSSDIIFQKSKELTTYKSWENVSGTFTLSKKTTIVIAPMGGGVLGDWNSLNMNIKNIQLELGSTATEYEPYKAVGEASKNLMKYPHLFGKSITHNGVTFTIDADGVVTINGTPKGIGQCNIDSRNFLNILDSTKNYTLSGVVEPRYNSDGSYVPCQINMVFTNKGSFVKNISPYGHDFSTRINLSKVTEEFDECHIQILVYGNVPDKIKFYPQIEEGTKRTEWCPNGKYRIPLVVSGKNLFNGYGFSAMGMITPTASRNLSNDVGTTISTTSPSNTLTVTQSKIDKPGTPNDYRNGYFCIGLNEDIKIGKIYRFYCDAEITNNPLNVSTFDLGPNNQMLGYTATYNNGKLIGSFLYAKNGNRRFLEIRNRGCNMTISNIMITESEINDTVYEPFLNPMITSIYLGNPLGSGECLDFKRQKLIKPTSQTDVALPKVQVFKGTSVIRTDTEVSPTNIKAKYIKY